MRDSCGTQGNTTPLQAYRYERNTTMKYRVLLTPVIYIYIYTYTYAIYCVWFICFSYMFGLKVLLLYQFVVFKRHNTWSKHNQANTQPLEFSYNHPKSCKTIRTSTQVIWHHVVYVRKVKVKATLAHGTGNLIIQKVSSHFRQIPSQQPGKQPQWLGRTTYLSSNTCLMRPHLFCVFRRVREHRTLLQCSPLLKKTSAGQVVLDKWLPMNDYSKTSSNHLNTRKQTNNHSISRPRWAGRRTAR